MLDAALFDSALTAFVTLFVVVDPIAVAPIFVALTAGASGAQRRRIAIGAVAIAAGVLAAFGLFGLTMLNAIGVGLPAFRISGGLMLFLIAVEMLFEKRTERRARAAHEASHDSPDDSAGPESDPTVFPLATPLLAGPGAMASMILLSAEAESGVESVAIYVCLGAVLLICLGLFFTAGLIERAIGPTGVKLVTRLFGVLLGALSVQFVLDGLAAYGVIAGPD